MMEIDPHGAGKTPTAALIVHILSRYHDTHRRELPELPALVCKVKTVHAGEPNTPHGLTQTLEAGR